MIGKIFPVILLFFLVNSVYAAEKTVVFKVLHKNEYEIYISTQDDYRSDTSLLGSISRHLLQFSFQVDKIPAKYYTIKRIDSISFFGFDVTQYIIIPKDNSRFKQILWLDNYNNIIKLEVYNNLNKLMLAFSGFDFMTGAICDCGLDHKELHERESKEQHKDKEQPKDQPQAQLKDKPEDTNGEGIDRPINNSKNKSGNFKGRKGEKYKFWDSGEFYKGFKHIHTTVFEKNVFDLSFEDGINRFSMFIKPVTKDIGNVSNIIYGNYLFTRVIDNIEYAVYGTVSFGFMEEIVNLVHKNLDKIREIVYEGKVLTPEVYTPKK